VILYVCVCVCVCVCVYIYIYIYIYIIARGVQLDNGADPPWSQVPLMLASPQEIIKIWLVIIEVGSLLFYAKKFGDLCIELA
jgi:hypothetical protein